MTRPSSPTVRTKSLIGGVSRGCPVRVKWYNLISESPELPLRLAGSYLAGDKVSAGVGVEERVEDVEGGCVEEAESASFASRILVGSEVRMS